MANLEFRYGVMSSGKSMSLLQMAYNYEKNNKKILVIKSAIDTKEDDYVISRIGPKRKVDVMLEPGDSLLCDKYLFLFHDLDAILVDEAQFLTESQVNDLWMISKKLDIPVVCFGLKTNYMSNLFEGSKRLIEVSDKLTELDTICSCGVKARFNARMVDGNFTLDGDEVIIDNEESTVKYVPLCSKCYLKKVFKKKYK